MKSFMNFIDKTKEALFGCKTVEDVKQSPQLAPQPPPQPPQKNQLFDEELYYQYMEVESKKYDLQIEWLGRPISYTDQALQLIQEVVAKLSFDKLVELKQVFYSLRRQSFMDLEQYARIIKNEQQQNQLIVDITLSFIVYKYKINERLLGFMMIHNYVSNYLLQNQCKRVLFCKEEILEHLSYQPTIPNSFLRLNIQTRKLVMRQMLADMTQEQTNINDSDEFKFMQLFADDEEVKEKANKKQQIIVHLEQLYL